VNSQTAVERALRLINPVPSEEEALRWRSTLNTLIEPARMEMVDQLLGSGDREWRELLRKEWTPVTATDGRAPLTALVTDPEPLVVKYFNTAEIYLDSITRKVTLLPDETSVTRDRMPGFPVATLIGTELLIYNGGQAYTGDLKVRGPYMPALASFNQQLDEKFVLVLAAMGKQQTPSKPRTQTQEMKAVAAEGK
jgi:hypothetical protein